MENNDKTNDKTDNKTDDKTDDKPDEKIEVKLDFRTFEFKHAYPELEGMYNFQNKMLTKNKQKINFVVTHGGCSDGFMSATIVRQYLKEQNIDLLIDSSDNSAVTFFNAYYGNDFSKLPDMMKDKYVIICDFSFPKNLFDKMIEATNGNILILDHHKTAQKSLQEVPTEYVTFDMNHSGAFITWTYFYGFDNVPKAVLYVEDNDIWTKKLPQTREFTAYMFAQKFEFDEYDKFFGDKYLCEYAFPIGTGMVLQNDSYINQLVKKCIPKFVDIKGRYYFISCVNSAGLLRSELGNFILTVHKNANLSMVYAHDPYTNYTSISYRSLDDRSDTTEIAKINGGGGHRNASGAGIPHEVDSPSGRVIDACRAYFMLNKVYETNINGRPFLALNTACIGKHLIAYLMQERYINDEGKIKNKSRSDVNLPGYQEGLFVMRNRYDDSSYDKTYSGAFAWCFDGFNNTYKIVVKTLPNVFKADLITNIQSQVNGLVTITELKNNVYDIIISTSHSIEQIFKLLM